METGLQCAEGAVIQPGGEFRVAEMGGIDTIVEGVRTTPADVIYRVATVTAVLYLLVSVL